MKEIPRSRMKELKKIQTTIEQQAKAIVADAFRNNHKLEELHANGKISQDDMKTIMKHAVDHVNLFFVGNEREATVLQRDGLNEL
jgi:hypothetical protein